MVFYAGQNKVISSYHALELGKLFNVASKKKYLAIDDVGTESVYNDYGSKSELFADLIALAERNSSVLFITTNLKSEQFIARYGERIINRIEKLCRIVKFEGESQRK